MEATRATEADLRTAALTLRRALENLLVAADYLEGKGYDDEIREAEQAVEYATDVLSR